ncbi:unnamed protein product [Adineta steineri]|uniref:G-protein coupled receptors family 1 profile domain-containing protein n=2 Tax=Adineta steineri TaxID=433720 RepID=A0A814TVZ9_9BILA|nr:unnamed protein product [Adineta steineri]
MADSDIDDFKIAFFHKFKSLEWDYLQSLSDAKKKLLSRDDQLENYNPCHILEYGEIFATLCGLKPCTLLAHYVMPEYATGLVEKALKPLFDEYQLEKEGFELWKLKSPVTVLYKGGWIFTNKKHEQYSLVKQVFTTTASYIDTVDIGRALGYPLPYGKYKIQYLDDTESEERNTCCVPILEYNVGAASEENFTIILFHLDEYAKLWKRIGRNLIIDLSAHPLMEKCQIYVYAGLPIVIIGVLGGILNIIIFLSLRIFRENSCGVYLIIMSLVNIIQLLSGFFYLILVKGLLINGININVGSCTIRVYTVQICALISMSCICMALIDQYMATSKYIRLQQWSHRKIAYRLCAIISLFWIVYCSPHLIYYNAVFSPVTNSSICTITNSNYQSYVNHFYTPILLDAFPLLFIIIFGLLLYRNIKQISYRTAVPLVRRQHEIQITSMVLIQALISVLLISPFFILTTLTSNIQFSIDPIINAHIQLVLGITICIYYSYYTVPFYIYICVSKRYRQQFFHVLYTMYFQRWCKPTNDINQVAPEL